MKNSSSRILTTHIGSLVRPTALVEIMRAKESGQSYDREELAAQVRDSTRDVVQKQLESGVDIPSDGEYGKPSFSGYANERLSGFEPRPIDPNESPLLNWGRERQTDVPRVLRGVRRGDGKHPGATCRLHQPHHISGPRSRSKRHREL